VITVPHSTSRRATSSDTSPARLPAARRADRCTSPPGSAASGTRSTRATTSRARAAWSGNSEFAFGAVDGTYVPEWFRGCFRVKRGEEIVLASDRLPPHLRLAGRERGGAGYEPQGRPVAHPRGSNNEGGQTRAPLVRRQSVCQAPRLTGARCRAAEGVGFEPTVGGLPLQRFSRPPDSATLAPLRGAPAQRRG
jgi:hypothetical protein